MHSIAAISVFSLALGVLAQDTSSSSSSTPAALTSSANPLPTLLSDVKVGDVYEITLQAPDGTQSLTTSAGSVEPSMQSIYTMPLMTTVVMGWDTKGEIHEEVLQDANGTVYTTTITRTGTEWFAALSTPTSSPSSGSA